MSGVNKVIIIGRLGQDPEVRFMPNGKAAANFAVATSDKWKDKQTGEQKEKTEWHRITMFERLAEIAGEYLVKGSNVYLEGKLQTRKWQNQQGQDQYTTEVLVNNMQMLDSKNQTAVNKGQQVAKQQVPAQQGYQSQQNPTYKQPQQQGGFQGQQMPSQQLAQKRVQQQAPKVNPQEPTVDFDDDIPFAPIGLQHRSILNCI